MSKDNLLSARCENLFANRRDIHEKRRCQSQLSTNEDLRSASQQTLRPALTAYCAHCKLPLLIDINTHETKTNKSRALASRTNQRVCEGCAEEKVKNVRTPSSRLFKSASVDWTNVGDKIENWFETAHTPDQRVVYNFLEKININDQEKELDRTLDSARGRSLDDILNNLKKYRARFNSSRSQNKFQRSFESTSWRVMRHPSTTPRQFSRYNAVYGDDASRDFRIGTVFTTTEPRIGSTFLLHPGWV
ncbi:unnamed protein product [Rotaria sordida]|uniref:Uncharacterized protein n=1 Tax=Rotaria sordida TaxID=392033 RepID=A0A814NZG3_9BILA|nr:unnamed protein product [Rotaria sordida]CAF3856684.1 unnamed protein product [Rotaria sordida]